MGKLDGTCEPAHRVTVPSHTDVLVVCVSRHQDGIIKMMLDLVYLETLPRKTKWIQRSNLDSDTASYVSELAVRSMVLLASLSVWTGGGGGFLRTCVFDLILPWFSPHCDVIWAYSRIWKGSEGLELSEFDYRLRSRGNYTFGSVRPSVCLSVCPSMLSRLVASIRPSVWAQSGQYWYLALPSTAKGPAKHKSATLLKNIRECSSQGAFNMVGRSKLLLFRRVAPSQSITLLIVAMFSDSKLKQTVWQGDNMFGSVHLSVNALMPEYGIQQWCKSPKKEKQRHCIVHHHVRSW